MVVVMVGVAVVVVQLIVVVEVVIAVVVVPVILVLLAVVVFVVVLILILTFESLVVTFCTNMFKIKNSTVCTQIVFGIYLTTKNNNFSESTCRIVLINEKKLVHCAVRAEYLHIV
jgi:hypothetical protein